MIEIRALLRELARAPGYVAAVLFSLATGMSVCVAVFSIVNTLVFTEVPGIDHRSTLLRLTSSDGLPLSAADLAAFARRAAPSLRAVAAQGDRAVAVVLPSGPAVAPAAFVSPDFFAALGTRAIAGRLLTPSDADGANPPAVAISEALWRSAYSGDPSAVGRAISIAGRAFTIGGVTPHGFPGLDIADVGTSDAALPQLFVPLRFAAMWPGAAAPATRWLTMAARIDAGARPADVRREVAVVGDRVAALSPAAGARRSLHAFPMGLDLWSAPAESALVIVLYLFVPLGILAIGCGNVINLQLARAHERAGELSVRLALGASGARIARLLGAEIVPMAVAAGALGWAGARLLLASAESFVPLRFALDERALAFSAVVVCLVAIGGGLLPAWLAARDVVAAGLRTRHGTLAHTRLRHLLVVAQVAGSVALVALATLAARTFRSHAPALPPDAASTLVAQLNLADARPNDPRAARFVRTMLDTLKGDPAVRDAGIADFLVSGRPVRYRFSRDAATIQRAALGGVVTDGWFDATRTKMLSGRPPAASRQEAAVNDAFAARAGMTAATLLASPLHVSEGGGDRVVQIVGVFSAASLEAEGHAEPMLLLSMPAIPPPSLVLTVRAADTARARQSILAAARRFDPALPFARLDTLETRLDEMLHGFKEVTVLAGVLSAIALMLAGAGLYALMSYTVRRRTREIGIRIAVGATPADVLALVGRSGFLLVAAGGVLGLLVATPIAMAMRSMFYGMSPWSPSIGLPACAVLLLVSAAAAWLPGWRAVRVDPIAVLREE